MQMANYEIFSMISTICFLFSGGFLAVSILLYFLWGIRKDMDYLSGRAAEKAIEAMREEGTGRSAQGKPGDLSKALRKRNGSGNTGEMRESRRLSGRMGQPSRQNQAPAAQAKPADSRVRPAPRPAQADYFGTGYVPPSAAPAPRPAQTSEPERQTVVLEEEQATQLLEEERGTQLLGEEEPATQLLEEERGTQLLGEEESAEPPEETYGLTGQLQQDGVVIPPTAEDISRAAEIQAVEITILEDILLINSDEVIEA